MGDRVAVLLDLANDCPGCHRHPAWHGPDCPLGARSWVHLDGDGVPHHNPAEVQRSG